MLTIDLLEGQGIPIKSRPEGIAIAATTFVVPLIIAIVMLSCYLSNSVAMSVRRQEAIGYQAKINKLSDVIELQKSFEGEKNAITSSLSEVLSSIDRYTQWSPIVETLVRNMPDSIVLTRLEGSQKFAKKDNTIVPVRMLRISVNGSLHHNCDKAVRDYRDRLRFSALLEPRLEDIRVSQEVDTLGGQDVVSYEIDCFFRPGL